MAAGRVPVNVVNRDAIDTPKVQGKLRQYRERGKHEGKSVKRALLAGERSLGTMVFEFPTTGIARIAAEAGAEFVIYDMEHTGWSIETIRNLMATPRAADLVPMVRVPATEYHLISRPLDVGAMGIMVPMVESEEQARRIADSANTHRLGAVAPPSGWRTTTTPVATSSPR